MPSSQGYGVLDQAVELLLRSAEDEESPKVLWRLRYEQPSFSNGRVARASEEPSPLRPLERVLVFPPPSADVVFDDSVLSDVKRVWAEILGSEAQDFMKFPERESSVMDD